MFFSRKRGGGNKKGWALENAVNIEVIQKNVAYLTGCLVFPVFTCLFFASHGFGRMPYLAYLSIKANCLSMASSSTFIESCNGTSKTLSSF